MATKDVPDTLVCQVVSEMADEPSAPDRHNLIDRLMERTGQCEKVCYSAAFRSAGRDLIEYGVSVRWPWLTDKGNALLNQQEA